MNIRHPSRIWLAGFLVAWILDQLFWMKTPGISIAIIIWISIIAGFVLTWLEGVRPAPLTWVLLAPIALFSSMTFIRLDGFTTFVNLLMCLVASILLVLTFQSGNWILYSLADDVVGFFRLAGSALIAPFELLFRTRREAEVDKPEEQPKPRKAAAWAILRGLLLALPVVTVMAALLASADPIFNQRLKDWLSWFDIDKIGEYIIRAVYITILAFLLVGIFIHALVKSNEKKLIGVEKPWLPAFLGWTEAVIVLGAVDLLFLIFVIIQFQYFFGGNANINLEGYTYAEYARRGFGEMVAVAVLSLLLLLGLGTATQRKNNTQRISYSGLGVFLVALVGVILVSAFQRLLLYETAYGFTQVRTYTHVFIITLGLLLLATIALELFGKLRAFAFAALLASLCFGIALNMINVDRLIVRQNSIRAVNGYPLDTGYLVSLTDDAVPELLRLYQDGQMPVEVHDQLGAAIACKAAISKEQLTKKTWSAFHLSRYRAQSIYQGHPEILEAYPTRSSDLRFLEVKIGGNWQSCYPDYTYD